MLLTVNFFKTINNLVSKESSEMDSLSAKFSITLKFRKV